MRRWNGALTLCASLLLAACVAPTPPAERAGFITLGMGELKKSTSRPPVSFPHEAHWAIEGVSCSDCHHDPKAGRDELDMGKLMSGDGSAKCASCHSSAAKLEAAFHLLCINCHDRLAAAKPKLPRSCGDCHPWSPKR